MWPTPRSGGLETQENDKIIGLNVPNFQIINNWRGGHADTVEYVFTYTHPKVQFAFGGRGQVIWSV